eukprot:766526-Hanusia_phi.AAC.2
MYVAVYNIPPSILPCTIEPGMQDHHPSSLLLSSCSPILLDRVSMRNWVVMLKREATSTNLRQESLQVLAPPLPPLALAPLVSLLPLPSSPSFLLAFTSSFHSLARFDSSPLQVRPGIRCIRLSCT